MNNNNLLSYWLSGTVTSLGANGRELLLSQAEHEYNKGNHLHSAFYQVRGLYQTLQQRLFTRSDKDSYIPVQTLLDNFNDNEKQELLTNPLLISALAELSLQEHNHQKMEPIICDFLQNIHDAEKGVQKIANVCQQFPPEWTVLQICKSPHSETTHAIYPQIRSQSSSIYLTVLRHARSADYPLPIVVCIDKGEMQKKMFQRQGNLADSFKQCINVDPASCSSRERRMHYWRLLAEYDDQIKETLSEMRNLLFPWCFLMLGQPNSKTTENYQQQAFKAVDQFCDKHSIIKYESRVLLSLAALHVLLLDESCMKSICQYLLKTKTQQAAAEKMLVMLQSIAPIINKQYETFAHYACILIVDERLDHFFWEETFVQQEYTRVNSLQCLWHLYETYKQRIKNGYLQLKINTGACIVNPDKNLPNTEMRMKSFMKHWRPEWQLKCGEVPEQDEFINFFKNDCYIYAGHGSGLQYITGNYIAKQRIESVVFLFGCDSTRMHSQGLYSELIGPHLYYQAALCPTFVGTLMPGLDAYMDGVAAQILSHWITPTLKSTLDWSRVESTNWSKQGLIKCVDNNEPPLQQKASLCSVMSYVHQRHTEKKYYNTVQFVCRGLPAWNCNVVN